MAAIPIVYRRLFPQLSAENGEDAIRTLRRVSFMVQTDSTEDIDFTLKVWEMGYLASDIPSGDPHSITLKTLECAASSFTNAPRLLVFPLECVLRWPMIELSADVASDLRVKFCHLEYSEHGDTITADSGTPGTPHPDGGRFVRYSPEFDGAVLYYDDAVDTHHTGTMTAGYDATNDFNAYKWTTDDTSNNQVYRIVVKVGVPQGYTGWTNCKFYAHTTGDTGSSVQLAAILDTSGAALTFTPVTATGAWAAHSFSVPAGTFTVGSRMTLIFKLTAAKKASSNNYAYLGPVEMDAW